MIFLLQVSQAVEIFELWYHRKIHTSEVWPVRRQISVGYCICRQEKQSLSELSLERKLHLKIVPVEASSVLTLLLPWHNTYVNKCCLLINCFAGSNSFTERKLEISFKNVKFMEINRSAIYVIKKNSFLQRKSTTNIINNNKYN